MENQIFDLIKSEVTLINNYKGSNINLELSDQTSLYGSEGVLDSLDLINLIVGLEKLIQEKYNKVIFLADDRALTQEISPFTTIGTLTQYITGLLKNSDE